MDPHWSRMRFERAARKATFQHEPSRPNYRGGATQVLVPSYLLAGRCGLRRLPSWRGMSSAAEHHGHAGRRSSMVGAE